MRGGWVGSDVWDKVPPKKRCYFGTPTLRALHYPSIFSCLSNLNYFNDSSCRASRSSAARNLPIGSKVSYLYSVKIYLLKPQSKYLLIAEFKSSSKYSRTFFLSLWFSWTKANLATRSGKCSTGESRLQLWRRRCKFLLEFVFAFAFVFVIVFELVPIQNEEVFLLRDTFVDTWFNGNRVQLPKHAMLEI